MKGREFESPRRLWKSPRQVKSPAQVGVLGVASLPQKMLSLRVVPACSDLERGVGCRCDRDISPEREEEG